MVFMALFDAPLPRQSVSPVISIFLPSTSSFHLPHSLYPSLIPCRMKCIGGAIHLLPPPPSLSDTGSQLTADRKGPIKH